MRSFFTFVLTVLFIVGFATFFGVSAVLGYARDTDAVVAGANAAEARESAVELVTEMVYQELKRDPRLAGVPRFQISAAVASVIDQAWFDDALRGAHRSLVAAVDGAADTAVIELEPTKASLVRALAALEARAQTQCAQILGSVACASNAQAEAALAAFGEHSRAAVASIPERLSVVEAVEAAGRLNRVGERLQLDQLQSRRGTLQLLRWLGLGLLALGLGLIAAINSGSTSRMLRATGRALAVAAALYLAVCKLLLWFGPGSERHLAWTSEQIPLTPVQEIALRGSERLAIELAGRALDRATDIILVCLAGGALLWALGVIFRRR
ncbi:hypothetical protein [Haliangium sp.]|uniref:hypothetical protein n=1 Tax=Haliangium sp. TaxID=2663208 RepID=UPI003D0AAD54